MMQFPILGLRADGEPFQYLPVAISGNCLQIAIFNWFMSRAYLNIGDEVDLLTPCFSTVTSPGNNKFGKVVQTTPDPTNHAVEYKIIFDDDLPQLSIQEWASDVFIKDINSPSHLLYELLIQYVKDTKLLKSGVAIYLKHFKAYFSRISPYSRKEYAEINKLLICDIELHVRQNEKKLEELYLNLETNLKRDEDIAVIVDLEQLREMVESELSLALLSHVFSGGKPDNQVGLSISSQAENPCIVYLTAIKSLERRLYINYNTIVLIYTKALV